MSTLFDRLLLQWICSWQLICILQFVSEQTKSINLAGNILLGACFRFLARARFNPNFTNLCSVKAQTVQATV